MPAVIASPEFYPFQDFQFSGTAFASLWSHYISYVKQIALILAGFLAGLYGLLICLEMSLFRFPENLKVRFAIVSVFRNIPRL